MDEQILGTAKIPRVAHYNYPLTVTFRIRSEGQRLSVEIHPRGMAPKRFPIELSRHDLASISEQLSEAIEEIAIHCNSGREQTETERESHLRRLASIGNYAFQSIFRDSRTQQKIQELFSSNDSVYIEVVSEEFILPWELIYPVDLDQSPPSFDNFWGMKYAISRVLVDDNRLGASWIGPDIVTDPIPKLGLLANEKLPGVRGKEIPFFKDLERTRRISLFTLRNLDPLKRVEELVVFKDFWTNSYHIAHFACHAFYENARPNLSYLRLSDDFDITHQEIVVQNVDIIGNPLVVINACEGGNLNPLYTSYFAALFLERGARAVVATECEVPDTFAADFAQKLYSYLLAGEEIGKSLLATRRYFWQKHRNPSGLLYSLYGPPTIKLV